MNGQILGLDIVLGLDLAGLLGLNAVALNGAGNVGNTGFIEY